MLAPSVDANMLDGLVAAPLAGKNIDYHIDNNTLSATTKAELILKATKVYDSFEYSCKLATNEKECFNVVFSP
ncbi:MAG TPA: hypothetical protein DD730_09105 [Desulfosporosinus sp.]|jgi:hypothetical protein|nr:hypothetical protein [Desulfosporosinus sp.]